MSETKDKTRHTPGPWEVEGGLVITARAGRLTVCEVHDHSDTSADHDALEAEANARRIVACVNACEGINPDAAPELLACLKDAVESFRGMDIGDPGEGDPIGHWKAAISKAEGRG